ncbi:MAG: hypothetical protein HZA78_10675 [Candidatus Schekmanbacteria bacterium]|nr:hypothetical protein [Candidatus Schekmanbacteria bacterium]
MKNNNTARKYLGPKETEVIARLSYEKATIVTAGQFDEYFNFPPAERTQIIFRLKKKGILSAIKKGLYVFSPLESGPAGRNINEFLIASALFPKGNYYIGYSSMYNYYGVTDQIYQTIFILNTTMQREKTIGCIRFKMIKIPSSRMYGLEKIRIGDVEVIVSDRERTLVDVVFYPDPVGGLKKALDIIMDQVSSQKISLPKFIKYASIFPSVSTRKRIGITLDKCGVADEELYPLLKSIQGSSLTTLYKATSRKGRINRKWGLIENAASE